MVSRTQRHSLIVAILVITSTLGVTAPAVAAGSTEVAVDPGSQTIDGGTTTTVDIVVQDASGGVGSYEFTLSSSNASVAAITDVSAKGNLVDINTSSDGSQTTVTAASVNTADTGAVTVATVTLAGEAAGTADISLSVASLGDENGNAYSVSGTPDGTIEVLPSTRIDGLSVRPDTVDENTTVAQTTTFDIINLSADGNTDTINVAFPADTAITVDDITVTSDTGAPIAVESSPSVQKDSANRTVVGFGIAPDNSIDTDRVGVTLNVTATYPSVSTNTTGAVDADVSDSNGESATAGTSVAIQNTDTSSGTGDGTVSAALEPANQNVSVGGNVTYEIVLENVDNGVGSYEFVVSTADTGVATITDATLQGTTGSSLTSVNVASDGSSVEIVASNTDTANTGTVPVATITVAGQATGTTSLDLSLRNGNPPGDESGNTYNVSSTSGASVTARAGPGDVTGNGDAATDPDGDGVYEDLNGDGSVTGSDVTVLFNAIINGDADITQGPFDINNEGDGVTGADVTALFNAVLDGRVP